jgi:hypothetical protein
MDLGLLSKCIRQRKTQKRPLNIDRRGIFHNSYLKITDYY